ncbi:MAG TPA: hypothetical protein VEG34_02415 [Thermoanaerobaculia bacterium]|nr:hypothetical protein [Thermoanaerobaculia bacterium]
MGVLLTMIALALTVGAGGAAVWAGYRSAEAEHRRRAEELRAAGQAAGLTFSVAEENLVTGPSLDGRLGPLQVHLSRYGKGKHDEGTRIAVQGFGPGAAGLSLEQEGVLSGFIDEIEVGSPGFDRDIHVQGAALLLLALLDAGTRRRVSRLMQGFVALGTRETGETGKAVAVDARLRDGLLEVWVKDGSAAAAQLGGVLAGVLEVAWRLQAPDDIPGRLAENLRSEPETGVRLKILRVLQRELPEHPATLDSLLAALGDPSDDVRLRAAVALGEAGRGTLLDLVASEATADSCAARAVAALGGRLPAEQAEAALGRALARGHFETARACMEELAFRWGTCSEGVLLQALASGEPALILAAVHALGQMGTVAAVAPLRPLAEPRRGELAAAARQAIAAIQSRLTGAAPGQLSLAAGEAGALSLAPEAGAVSLTPTAEAAAARRHATAAAEPGAAEPETAWPDVRSEEETP